MPSPDGSQRLGCKVELRRHRMVDRWWGWSVAFEDGEAHACDCRTRSAAIQHIRWTMDGGPDDGEMDDVRRCGCAECQRWIEVAEREAADLDDLRARRELIAAQDAADNLRRESKEER